jgi:hypothetical protein
MRSQLVERVRLVAPRVLKLPEVYFRMDYDRSNVPELQALLKFDVSRWDVSKFAPILYPSAARAHRNDKKIFMAEELAKVSPEYTSLMSIDFIRQMPAHKGRSFRPSFT